MFFQPGAGLAEPGALAEAEGVGAADAAVAVRWLLFEAGYVTGQVVAVDGGFGV